MVQASNLIKIIIIIIAIIDDASFNVRFIFLSSFTIRDHDQNLSRI